MKSKINISNFQLMIESLTPESQQYLLILANMADVAEKGKEKQMIRIDKPKQPA